MIPGAIPGKQFEASGRRYVGKQVVVYCTIGYRSGLYAKRLDKQDRHVFNLKGGILAWAHAGQAAVNLNGQTNRVHLYGREWNLLPHGYEAVW
jgi:rhodanese-related sulfurtransferase